MTGQNQIDPDSRPEQGRAMPSIGHFLQSLGVDPASATDDPPRVQFVGDRVFVRYTGLVTVSPAEFSRAAVNFDEWSPA